MNRPALTCGYDHCDQPARLYPGGFRCANHTPAWERGLAEAPETGTPWWVRDGVALPLVRLPGAQRRGGAR